MQNKLQRMQKYIIIVVSFKSAYKYWTKMDSNRGGLDGRKKSG